MKLTEYIGKVPKNFIAIASISLTLILGFLDHLTGPDFSFSIFYLIPIFLAAWAMGKRAGMIIAAANGLIFFLLNAISKPGHLTVFIGYWDSAVIFGFYLIFAYMLWTVKNGFDHEKELARTDSLTGVANGRAFMEIASLELERAQRYKHPLAMAYLDLDNFKTINDQFGHKTGDLLLYKVAQTIQSAIRKTDVVARLGGDEFAILMPETESEPAPAVVDRIQKKLIEEMKINGWNVTFSIGAALFLNPPASVDELIKITDDAMYSIKNNGKNLVKHVIITE